MDDVRSHSKRRLATILRDPKHPLHSAAKAELDRRGMQSEGAMKRIATTQSNKADRMASTDKKGLETFKKFRKKMNEKTLTPAEKKKREEIAKSMERDNPGMPMAKKMAIATATAKRVAEDWVCGECNCDPCTCGEEINEAKMSTAAVLKAAKALASNGKDAKTKSFGKGLVDFHSKNGSFTPDQVAGLQNIMKNASFQMAKEETIQEISIDKLSRYGKAAAKDIEKHRNTVRSALDQPASPKKAKAGLSSMQKLTKRSRGSDMYVNKMTGRSKVKPSASTVGKDKQVAKEGKAYGPTGVSYYVPSGHKDEVDPKTGKKYPERQKPGYKAPTNEEKDTHVTKDGRTVKKGLWYYMNKRKKAGTSRPKSAGTVDPKMMKKSQE